MALPFIGAALGIGTGLINRQWRRKEEKGRRVYEKKQELDRRKYDQAMWDKVNKYNNPIEQMARLKGAGLNPNLIYGSSPGSAVGNAQSIATGKQLQGQAPQYQMDNPINSFMNTRMQQAQSNNLKADSNLKTAQAIKAGKDSGVSEATLEYLERTMDSRTALQDIEVEIKTITRELNEGMKPHLIANQMAMTRKNQLAADILNKEKELMSQGYYKGNQIATIMKGVFNLDLSNPDDRLKAQIVATAALTSHLVGNMSGAFKKALEAFKIYKK